jgi:hypothetical protein
VKKPSTDFFFNFSVPLICLYLRDFNLETSRKYNIYLSIIWKKCVFIVLLNFRLSIIVNFYLGANSKSIVWFDTSRFNYFVYGRFIYLLIAMRQKYFAVFIYFTLSIILVNITLNIWVQLKCIYMYIFFTTEIVTK